MVREMPSRRCGGLRHPCGVVSKRAWCIDARTVLIVDTRAACALPRQGNHDAGDQRWGPTQRVLSVSYARWTETDPYGT